MARKKRFAALDPMAPRRSKGLSRETVSIAEILLSSLERAEPGPEADKRQFNKLKAAKHITKKLKEFWGPKTVADIDAHEAEEYGAWRIAQNRQLFDEGKRTKPTLSRRTIIAELEYLKTQVNAFAAEQECNWPDLNFGSLRHPSPKLRADLSRSDIVRLIWGSRGARYEGQPQLESGLLVGLKPRVFRPGSGLTVPATPRKMRAHISRLLLICYYTGSTVSCALNLRWTGEPEGQNSFVDVVGGLLYRLGPDAAFGKPSGMPVPICFRLLIHLRQWREADLSLGWDRVIHSRTGKPINNPPDRAFHAVCKDAGYQGGEILMNMILDITGAELMRKAVSIRSAALFIGLTPATIFKRYARHREDFHDKARRALEIRPQSIRTMPSMSIAWRDARIRRR